MKKYTNIDTQMLCVEFEGLAQFLRRGQSITNDLKTIRVPKGILVEDVVESAPEVKKSTKKRK